MLCLPDSLIEQTNHMYTAGMNQLKIVTASQGCIHKFEKVLMLCLPDDLIEQTNHVYTAGMNQLKIRISITSC
jgi:hypothetical protein